MLTTLGAGVVIAVYYVVRFRDALLMFFNWDDFIMMRHAARIHVESVDAPAA